MKRAYFFLLWVIFASCNSPAKRDEGSVQEQIAIVKGEVIQKTAPFIPDKLKLLSLPDISYIPKQQRKNRSTVQKEFMD